MSRSPALALPLAALLSWSMACASPAPATRKPEKATSSSTTSTPAAKRASRMELHEIRSCTELVRAHAEQRDDAAYLAQSDRARMQLEYRVARCHLQAGRADEARALAAGWTGTLGDAFGAMLHARIANQENDPDAVRTHLLAWIETGLARSQVLLDDAELRALSRQPWFADVVLTAWKRELADDRAPPLGRLVDRLAKEMGVSTSELRVASADPTTAVGSLAIWQGEVMEARVDRAKGKTYLLAQGFDIERILVDRRERVVQRTSQPMYGGWAVVPSLVEVEESYKEIFRLNGRLFGVVVDGVDEDVVRMPHVVVVGVVALADGVEDDDGDVRSVAYQPTRGIRLSSDEVPFLNAKLVLPREAKTFKKVRQETP